MAGPRNTTNEADVIDFTKYRHRYLPKQIAATRRKLAALENEARRYGMFELLQPETNRWLP